MGSLEQLLDAIAADVPAPEPSQTVKWWWDDAAQQLRMTVVQPEDLYLDVP
jgi:hypothetical protein